MSRSFGSHYRITRDRCEDCGGPEVAPGLTLYGHGYRFEHTRSCPVFGTQYHRALENAIGEVITIPNDIVYTPVKKENKMFNPIGFVSPYVEKHKDKIITLTVIFLVDHFVFKGKFRNKLENLFDTLTDRFVKSESAA